MNGHPLTPLFRPRSIAVFGASERPGSVGTRVFDNLVASGFEGELYPINPKRKTVAGRPCFRSIADLDAAVDLVVIATPATTVPGIVRDSGAVGVRHAIVLSAGFGESEGQGQRLATALRDAARRGNVSLLGPNSVGLVLPGIGVNASFLGDMPPAGHLALVSQSGALCSAIADWAGPNHLGLSALVSLGNASVLDFGDVLSYLAEDSDTHAILLYVEGVRDAAGFCSALRLAARTKPVIVLKSGRHAMSAQAASTHTGTLIGSDEVFDAAIERAGAVRAMTFGQLFAAAEILATGRRTAGSKLCILTNGGGAGVLAADRAEDLGMTLPPPSPATLEALDARLPDFWSRANPVDVLGDATPERYATAVRHCLADRAFDAVLVMLTPQAMTDPLEVAEAVIAAAGEERAKPLLACWMGERSVSDARERFRTAGIPEFTTPERAVEAFSFLARHALGRRLALEVPRPRETPAAADVDGARMIIESVLDSGREMLDDRESKAVLRAFRIPACQTIEARTAADALVAAESVGFPVAMKIVSPDISHKSDVDGVRLDIATAREVRPSFEALIQRAHELKPEAEIRGVAVEPMARIQDARELVVGALRDPVFGPTILFGAGGTLVEIVRDSAVCLPPLNAVLAARLIERTRAARLLDSFRNRAAVPRRTVIEVLLRVSEMLAELPHVEELDINPLLAGSNGVVAVDARFRVRRPRPAMVPYEHMAIAPWPRHLVEMYQLTDGSTLTIRPIRPDDAESEQRFVRELSSEAKRFRFMHALVELTPKMLARFTQIDYRREMALVAILGNSGTERQVGVARYVINPDGRSAEFAVVVSDDVRGRGIGSRLMHSLMGSARLHRVEQFKGEVLSNNKPMLRLMHSLDFLIEPNADDPDVVEVARAL